MASWCTIESDPGVFTELISRIGVKDVQVEELYDMSDENLARLQPVYGLIFLFKWDKKQYEARGDVSSDAADVFFAKQVINNACATQAIISVLMNRPEIELGQELTTFKEFAAFLPPEDRGLSIGNSEKIRKAHNSFARPEPFVQEEKATAGDDDDVYHFIGYVPVSNALWELDGLAEGPIKLADLATPEEWTAKAREAIQERMQKYSAKEIRFNLLALVKDRRKVLNERMAAADTRIAELKAQVEAGNADDEAQAQLTRLEDEKKDCEREVEAENEKRAKWRTENDRRKHNYVPFVYHLLKALAKHEKTDELLVKGKHELQQAAERASKATAAAAAEKDKNGKKDGEK
eukprot:TRINITY_DN1409_c0_g1_i1.p1 TRINITY_DN1409_c0_g1~~TRINITY_DN1409_c0_g1_i1.p1  ORF type:complete len:365 (-),score=203.26 TRINITY_DN1409_c0_g1_i1:108-1154(-)